MLVPCLIEAKDGRLGLISISLQTESDRGCAIFGAEILNTELEALLRALCLQEEQSAKESVDPLFKGDAPLASFSARIRLAYAFRLIPRELKRDLDLVRKLRNAFAHEPEPMTFATTRCQDLLRAILDKEVMGRWLEPDEKIQPITPQNRRKFFILKIAYLAGRLAGTRDALKKGVHAEVNLKKRRSALRNPEPERSTP